MRFHMRYIEDHLFQLIKTWPSGLRDRKGVSLVIALLILLVVTLLGISAISTTTFETNIAGNERLYNKAFYDAEAKVDIIYAKKNDYSSLYPNTAGIIGLIKNDSKLIGFPIEIPPDIVNIKLVEVGPPKKVEFTITMEGKDRDLLFPQAGKVRIEAVIEAVDEGPPPKYPGE